jgi:hypothetical protein
MTRILVQPYDLDQLRTLSGDGTRRVSGVVAVIWHQLVQHEPEQFEEMLCRLITGSKYGLADLDAKLVGCLNASLLLEVSGDVSLLLDNYDEMMAEEAAGGSDGQGP